MFFRELIPIISFDEIIIARSEVVAARLKETYLNNHQQKQQHPFIFSFEAFISYAWHESQKRFQTPFAKLLHPLQSVSLWSEIIHNSTFAIADAAYQAWKICQHWRIDIQTPFFNRSLTTQQWSQWAQCFTQRCSKYHQLDNVAAISTLIQLNILCQLNLPIKIKLLGFDNKTPLEEQFFSYLTQQGFCVEPLLKTDHFNSCSIETCHFEDLETAFNTMAVWALKTANDQPTHSIVCCVSNLEAHQESIISAFQNNSSFNVASSQLSMPLKTTKLVNQPIIQTVLDIIYLKEPFHLTMLSRLLRSFYLKDTHSERSKRIQFDRFLRSNRVGTLSTAQLIQWSNEHHCSQLAQNIALFSNNSLKNEKNMLPSQWACRWRSRLKQWNFPSLQELSAQEKSYYNQLLKVLDIFAELDHVTFKKLNEAEALTTFSCYIHHTETSAQGATNYQGIQLIDLQEANIINPDQCWALDSNPEDADYGAKTNPFLPYALQKMINQTEILVPTLDKLATLSKRLIFTQIQNSLVNHLSDYIPVKTTTIDELIKDTKCVPQKELIAYELVKDDWGPPLLNKHATGGIDLIKKQAMCPFRAFSDYRLALKSTSLNLPQTLPNRLEKAICLHRILKSFWEAVKTQTKLFELSEEELTILLNTTIDHHIEHFAKQNPYVWQPIFTKNEKHRLYKLLYQWMQSEKQRPFFEVKATEHKTFVRLGPLQLSLLVDRIDQLPNGNFLIIDYKTNRYLPARKNWLIERCTEPQLPLYALSMGEKAQAIAWAHLSLETGGKLLGLSAYQMNISGIRTLSEEKINFDWPRLMTEWKVNFEQIAHQFAEGYAAVNPKEGALSCSYCPYALLCRVHHSNY